MTTALISLNNELTDARKASSTFAHIDPRQKISSIKSKEPSGVARAVDFLPFPTGAFLSERSPCRPYRSIRILILGGTPDRRRPRAVIPWGLSEKANKTATDLADNGNLNAQTDRLSDPERHYAFPYRLPRIHISIPRLSSASLMTTQALPCRLTGGNPCTSQPRGGGPLSCTSSTLFTNPHRAFGFYWGEPVQSHVHASDA